MGMILNTNFCRKRNALGSSLDSRNCKKPCNIYDAGVSPGCTRHEIKMIRLFDDENSYAREVEGSGYKEAINTKSKGRVEKEQFQTIRNSHA